MRFKRHLLPQASANQINSIPFLTLVLLLLLFALLLTSFLARPGMQIKLPWAVTSDAVQGEVFEVIVDAQDVVFFQGSALSGEDLRKIFSQLARREAAVFIKADKRASLGKIIEVTDLARALGLKQVHIATARE